MEQTNSDAFHSLRLEGVDRSQRRLFVQRLQHLACGVQSLIYFQAQVAWHQWHRSLEEEVVTLRPVPAADLVDVAKSFGGDETRARALAFEHRIDGHGGTVDKKSRPGDVDFRPAHTVLNAPSQI